MSDSDTDCKSSVDIKTECFNYKLENDDNQMESNTASNVNYIGTSSGMEQSNIFVDCNNNIYSHNEVKKEQNLEIDTLGKTIEFKKFQSSICALISI